MLCFKPICLKLSYFFNKTTLTFFSQKKKKNYSGYVYLFFFSSFFSSSFLPSFLPLIFDTIIDQEH